MYILMLCADYLIDLNTARISYTSARTEEETRSKKSDKKIIIFKHVLYKNVEHGVVFNKIMHFIIVILLRL